MPFTFDPAACVPCFAPEYLSRYPLRGRSFTLKRLGLSFHGLSDCLYLGAGSQVLLPVEAGNTLPFLFLESCAYLSNERHLPAIAAKCLTSLETPAEMEEAVPLFPQGADNLWHWMTESLPKLLALEKTGYQGAYIVPFSPAATQTLEFLGIPAGRLLPGNGAYRVRRLILPQRLSGFSLPENMPLTDLLRQELLNAVGPSLPGAKCCYVRRTGTRKISNEDELLAVLRDFDFETMTPEELSLKEQLRYMTNAACSVMAHGANSTLTLLQPSQSVCVEFFGNRYVSYNNLHAVRLLKLRYHAVVEDLELASCPANNPDLFSHLRDGPLADITIDPVHVRILLENALG